MLQSFEEIDGIRYFIQKDLPLFRSLEGHFFNEKNFPLMRSAAKGLVKRKRAPRRNLNTWCESSCPGTWQKAASR